MTIPPKPPARRRTLAIHNAHPRLRFVRAAVAKVIAVLDAHAAEFLRGCPPGELSLAFVTDETIARVHGNFMSDPTPTDVITFEGDAGAGLAGEICVSADTAAAYAKAHGQDFAAELTLYVVHGWLHLAGYDDLQPAKKRVMRAAEQRALALLRATAAIPRFTLAPAKSRAVRRRA